jgi:hypothetical protein
MTTPIAPSRGKKFLPLSNSQILSSIERRVDRTELRPPSDKEICAEKAKAERKIHSRSETRFKKDWVGKVERLRVVDLNSSQETLVDCFLRLETLRQKFL